MRTATKTMLLLYYLIYSHIELLYPWFNFSCLCAQRSLSSGLEKTMPTDDTPQDDPAAVQPRALSYDTTPTADRAPPRATNDDEPRLSDREKLALHANLRELREELKRLDETNWTYENADPDALPGIRL